jgi:hypothetical protein
LGALLRVPSWQRLAVWTRRRRWRRIVGYPTGLNHEAFNYVSEFVPLEDVRQLLYALARKAKANKALDPFKLGGCQVLALDANEHFASRSHCCAACCRREVTVTGADGKQERQTEYYHRSVFAHLVGSNLVLDLEPIRPGEDECAAALRLLVRLRLRLGVRFFDVVTVDAWYAHRPFLQAVRKLGWEVVAVLKQAAREVYQEADQLRPARAQDKFRDPKGQAVELREVRDLRRLAIQPRLSWVLSPCRAPREVPSRLAGGGRTPRSCLHRFRRRASLSIKPPRPALPVGY